MTEATNVRLEMGDSVLFQTVGDEVVLLNLTSQEYFSLDPVGSDLWNLLMEESDLAVVVNRLAEQYKVDEFRIRADIQPLISELVALGLLKSAQGAIE